MISKIRLLSLIFLSFFIVACDFHLRGSIDLDFKSIQINGGSSGLNKFLVKRFKQNGIVIETKNPERTLEILDDHLDKRILSLSRSGSVKEYELIYRVSYRFKIQNNEWSDKINKDVTRDYTYDDNNRVAKELEEKNLVQGMMDEIVRSMVSQISFSN